MFLRTAKASNHSGNDFRQARILQTIQEIAFAMRGTTKPFRKWLSPCAETSNHSGKYFRHARKLQTIRETTFAMSGNIKPFGKQLSPCAEMPNLSGNDFRQAREHQTFCGGICGRPIRDINKKSVHLIAQMNALIKGGGYLLSRIALQYHRRKWA